MSKRFGGVKALSEVDLAIAPGTIHALVGENGAGKSTLGKILAGVHRPDGGELAVHGRTVAYRSARDALIDGITIIAQEPTLVPHRSVLVARMFAMSPRAGPETRNRAIWIGSYRRAYRTVRPSR